jgi:predicted transcriptional regulator
VHREGLKTSAAEYSVATATNWLEFAQKLQENARANLAADRKRLKDILAAKEDDETLAAIDEGIRDVKAVRVVPAEKVHELLEKWIADSSAPKRL